MLIKCNYVNGETLEIDVSDEVGEFYVDLQRKEDNAERRQRYHTAYSLDADEYEGEDFADYDTPETELSNKETSEMLAGALGTLTDLQYKRFMKFAAGMSYRKIAEEEGVAHKQVAKSIEAAREKLKKYLAKEGYQND